MQFLNWQCGFYFQLSKLKLHEIEVDDNAELEVFEKEKLEETDKEEEQYAITVLEEKKAQMKPNMAAIAEYKKKVILLYFFFIIASNFALYWHTGLSNMIYLL